MKEKTVLCLLGLCLLIRAVTIPISAITDNTESRYATISRDMADSGHWVTPMVWIHGNYVPFMGKPPLHFWVTALSIRLFGENEFSVRFPSLLAAFLIVILMWIILKRYVDMGWDTGSGPPTNCNIDTAHSAMLMLSSSIMFFVLSGAVVLDMTLSLCVSGAVLSYQAFLMEPIRTRKRLWSIAVFIFLGFGFLTKGPIAVVMFGIPVFLWTLFHKRWDTLKDHAWFIGSLLFLGITVPWFYLSEIQNPGFLKYFFYNENFLRFAKHEYGDLYGNGHQVSYGTAMPMLLLAGSPWTLGFAILLFKKKGRVWFVHSFKNERTSLFPLSVIGMTFFLCFPRQIHITYLLPALPFFAVWCAMLFRELDITQKTIVRVSMVMVISYGMVYPLTQELIAGRHSAKEIIRIAREAKESSSLSGDLIFVPRTPYSAYFYGKNFILPHPRQDAGLTILSGLNSGKNHLYVIHRMNLQYVSAELLGKLETVNTLGYWTLYKAAQKTIQ